MGSEGRELEIVDCASKDTDLDMEAKQELMKAVVRSGDLATIVMVKEVPIPQCGPEDVLVRVEASPINPSDEYFAKGIYGTKETLLEDPLISPGFEGSGVVVKVGAKAPQDLLNERVTFCTDPQQRPGWSGAWAQYIVLHHRYCMKTGNLPFEETCCFFINPLTLLAFLLEVKLRGSGGLVHTGASSALGKMLVKVCNARSVELINVVRSPEHETTLRALGAKHVLNQNNPAFVSQLTQLTQQLNITLCFDAVAGPLTGQLLAAMPPKSTVLIYGTLSLRKIEGISPKDLLFYGKRLEGYWLPTTPIFQLAELKEATKYILEDLQAGGKLFKPSIAKEIKLEECSKYIDGYKTYASQGKTIFRPNQV